MAGIDGASGVDGSHAHFDRRLDQRNCQDRQGTCGRSLSPTQPDKDLAERARSNCRANPWKMVTVSAPSDGQHPQSSIQVPAVERNNIDEQWVRSVPPAIPDNVLQAPRSHRPSGRTAARVRAGPAEGRPTIGHAGRSGQRALRGKRTVLDDLRRLRRLARFPRTAWERVETSSQFLPNFSKGVFVCRRVTC